MITSIIDTQHDGYYESSWSLQHTNNKVTKIAKLANAPKLPHGTGTETYMELRK